MRKSLRQLLPFSAIALMAGEACAAGFPQLDHTWYGNQIFWLFSSFLVLYAIVSTFIAPGIQSVLTVRSNAIDEAIREAERAKATAESTKHHSDSATLEARNHAAAAFAKAQTEASAEATQALSKLDQDIHRKLTQADTRIEEAKAKAQSAMNDATAKLADEMAAKLLGRSLSNTNTDAVVTRLKKTGS